MRALLSVYDKTGIVDLARGLSELGWELVSSGGTSAALAEAGIDHIEVADLTGAPEMLGGRVKTLHPTIHGGILADRSKPEHLEDIERQGIGLIDLVVCNLYPFSSDPSVELIDVGGPTMVRAAAKNHDHVGIVVEPAEYGAVLDELRAAGCAVPRHPPAVGPGGVRPHGRLRRRHRGVARRAGAPGRTSSIPRRSSRRPCCRPTIHLTLERAGSLRYGENPHQHGRPVPHRRPALVVGRRGPARRQGALVPEHLRRRRRLATGPRAARPPDGADVAVAIIKHANPCGAALDADLVTAYRRALDVRSAVGVRRDRGHRRVG